MTAYDGASACHAEEAGSGETLVLLHGLGLAGSVEANRDARDPV
jgi:hypothetical protein